MRIGMIEYAEKEHIKTLIGGGRHVYQYESDRLFGTLKGLGGGTTESTAESGELGNLITMRTARVLGLLTRDNQRKANIPSGDRSAYSLEHYKFMLEAPFEVSNKCCDVMKKEPAHIYSKRTKRLAITAEMASESRLRTQTWLEHGCNGFDMKEPKSTPMAFWTEQDVLLYIRTHDLKICSVYGDVVTDDEESGQMNLSQYTGCEMFDLGTPTLHCTGCNRTGCCLCGFGAQLENKKNSRFLRLKETHPQMYKMLEAAQNNGYTMRQAMEWCNERMTGRRHFYL